MLTVGWAWHREQSDPKQAARHVHGRASWLPNSQARHRGAPRKWSWWRTMSPRTTVGGLPLSRINPHPLAYSPHAPLLNSSPPACTSRRLTTPLDGCDVGRSGRAWRAPAEVIEYARWLGVEEGEDDTLLWVAREGLTAQLPPNWKPWYVVAHLRTQRPICISQCCITLTSGRDAPRYTAELALPRHRTRLPCACNGLSLSRFSPGLKAGPRWEAAQPRRQRRDLLLQFQDGRE